MTDKTIPQLYREAADLIDTWGLVRGANTDSEGRKHCSAAAVNDVAGRPVYRDSADLLTPLAEWIVVHFPAEIWEAVAGYLPDDPERVERILSGKFDSRFGYLGEARFVVERWNDFGWGSLNSRQRTKEEVVKTLRDCADMRELLDEVNQTVVEEVAVG